MKPDFWTSRSLAKATEGALLMLVGLLNHVDDAGRAYDEPALIKAAVFPLRDEVTREVVNERLDELVSTGAVCRYEVSGSHFIHLPAFLRHQKIDRPGKSALEPCPVHDAVPALQTHLSDFSATLRRAVSEPSTSAPRVLAQEGKGEDKEVDEEVDGMARQSPLLATEPPPTASPSHTSPTTGVPQVVPELVALYTSRCSVPSPDKEATLVDQINRLLADDADPGRLRQAVAELADKDYSPRALPKFYSQVRRVRPASALAVAVPPPTGESPNWAGGF